jgi:5-hydroxyisourate hydrolase
MARISTHVLDTAAGCPATGMPVDLEIRDGNGWAGVAAAATDDDGRVAALADVAPGTYRVVFDIRTYFGPEAFYPTINVTFEVTDAAERYHVPLILSPFGYTTYRGS